MLKFYDNPLNKQVGASIHNLFDSRVVVLQIKVQTARDKLRLLLIRMFCIRDFSSSQEKNNLFAPFSTILA